MSQRHKEAEQRRARRFWQGLSPLERLEVSEQLSQGSLDWSEWFASSPSCYFTRTVEDCAGEIDAMEGELTEMDEMTQEERE